jgi:AcrR family transcriptional regulator
MATAKLETRQVIRHTAKKMFKERGYAATSMRDLAREVGIEAASLYNHLSSKEELLHEICFDIAEQFFQAFQAAIAEEKNPSKKLKAAIKAHIGVIATNLDASAVFFHEWIFLKEPELSKFKKLRYDYELGFRNLIQIGIKEKDFKELNVKIAVFTIFSALNATYDLYKSNEKLTQEEIAESISNLLLKGLKK